MEKTVPIEAVFEGQHQSGDESSEMNAKITETEDDSRSQISTEGDHHIQTYEDGADGGDIQLVPEDLQEGNDSEVPDGVENSFINPD